MMDILLIVIGFVMILAGANYLTDGSAAIAKRLNVSEFIIGLTIVAVGTSMPEMVVSLLSSMDGQGDISIGNVVGSNIFNTFIALGACAIIRPVVMSRENMRYDIPLGILASGILVMVCWNGTIVRTFGIAMLLIYAALIFATIRRSKKSEEQPSEEPIHDHPLWLSIVMTVGGFVGLIYGGDLLLDGATSFATRMGISEKIIAITLLAGGTSLPEFAASVIALVKGKSGIALGNIIGSNVANILLVLGLSAAAHPLGMGAITKLDLWVVFASSISILLFAALHPRKELGRWAGGAMIAFYVVYMYLLIK